MTKENLMDALNGIDFDMVEEAQPKKRRKQWILWVAAAASMAAVVAVSLGMWDWNDPINPPKNDPPIISYFTGGQALTGKQEVVFGDKEEASGPLDILTPGFYSHTVLEVQVIEVLPDTYCDMNEYYYFNHYQTYHVARLRVLDQVNAEGFPDEIWLQYHNYDTQVFDGFDSFLISVQQIGVDNYLLLNRSQRRVDYFSDMFQINVGDLGYGSVIAFRDGRVDGSFWDRTEEQCPDKIFKAPGADFFFREGNWYPAAAGSAVRQVKENLLAQEPGLSECVRAYIHADDLFSDEESRGLKEYLSPESGNSFMHRLSNHTDPSIRYTRVINGFPTNEVIIIGEGVTRQGPTFTAEDLTYMPDIGQALEQMDLTELKPPHIQVEENMILQYAAVSGAYRKVGENLYGIVTVIWRYRFAESAEYGWIDDHMMDDCYYLYDEECNGKVVDREQLQSIIGDDVLIWSFSYDRVASIY